MGRGCRIVVLFVLCVGSWLVAGVGESETFFLSGSENIISGRCSISHCKNSCASVRIFVFSNHHCFISNISDVLMELIHL